MSYKLIDANALNGIITEDDYDKVLKMPYISADLPNGLDGQHYNLKQQSCEDAVEVWDGIHCQIVAPKGTFDKIYNDAEENEKAISVKDAIRVIKSWFEKIELNPDILIDSIISLPPVTPIRPKSAWVGYNWSDSNGCCVWGMYCSSCNKHYPFGAEQLGRANFCPNCGADMRGKNNE